MFQPLRVPLYVGYFILGIYAYQGGWFSENGYHPRLMLWAGLWLVSGLFYLGYRLLVLPTVPEPPLVVPAGNAVLFNTFCLSSLMAGVAFFQRKLNAPGFFWRTQSANSYGIYYIHPLILYPLAYLFIKLTLPLFIKAPLVILLAIFLSWAFTALVLKKAPILRRVF